jgi:SAM-dependent methyltransferase
LQVAQSGDASQLLRFNGGPGEIDPFVQRTIAATNGNMYADLVGKLKEYPIPDLRLPPGNGALFLEIGCNWGRWCVAASRAGYYPVGIDPSLKGVRAAQRVSRQLGISAVYAVADGRYLPFRTQSFDQVFSYSVLQHLSPEDVRSTLNEIGRVLRVGGTSTVQMPNVFGVRCLYHQVRRGFREAREFEVRYWTPHELRRTFQAAIGPSQLSVDGFFSLNAQISDARFLPYRYRAVVYASDALRRLSRVLRPLTYLADSLYVSTVRKD